MTAKDDERGRALEPQTRALLDRLAAAGIPEWHTLSVRDARRVYLERAALVAREPEPVAEVADRVIAGPAGALGVRVYRPNAHMSLPLLIYLHGGGWVLGNTDSCDSICRTLANSTPCVVVSVNYRLAPEHKYPAALHDAVAATEWAIAQAEELGGAADRIIVGGDSAGGNLSAALALRARDRGSSTLAGQLLLYPALDRDFETRSYCDNATGYYLSRADCIWFWDHYLPEGVRRDDPYAFPLRATDLRGLPPAAVITTEFDPLRDEGEAYAARLNAAGTPAQLTRFPGTTHGFMAMATELDMGKRALAEAAAWLRSVKRE